MILYYSDSYFDDDEEAKAIKRDLFFDDPPIERYRVGPFWNTTKFN